MDWPLRHLALGGGLLAMIFAAVAFTERRRASGKPMLAEYSFRSVWRMAGASLLGATAISGGIFVTTGSLSDALGIGGMLAGVIIFGSVRGLLSEYQRKRDGGQNLDRK